MKTYATTLLGIKSYIAHLSRILRLIWTALGAQDGCIGLLSNCKFHENWCNESLALRASKDFYS